MARVSKLGRRRDGEELREFSGRGALSHQARSFGVRGDRIQTAEQEDERERRPDAKKGSKGRSGDDVGELDGGGSPVRLR